MERFNLNGGEYAVEMRAKQALVYQVVSALDEDGVESEVFIRIGNPDASLREAVLYTLASEDYFDVERDEYTDERCGSIDTSWVLW